MGGGSDGSEGPLCLKCLAAVNYLPFDSVNSPGGWSRVREFVWTWRGRSQTMGVSETLATAAAAGTLQQGEKQYFLNHIWLNSLYFYFTPSLLSSLLLLMLQPIQISSLHTSVLESDCLMCEIVVHSLCLSWICKSLILPHLSSLCIICALSLNLIHFSSFALLSNVPFWNYGFCLCTWSLLLFFHLWLLQ